MKKVKFVILIILTVILTVVVGSLIASAIYSISYNNKSSNPILTVNVEQYGKIDIELYPEYAPNTVAAIIKLAQNGYYDGKVFYGADGYSVHAGMEKNVIDASDESTSSSSQRTAVEDVVTVFDFDKSVESESDKDYKVTLFGEFSANGYEKNTLRFEKGTVGLYREVQLEYFGATEESYNSGSSRFFILTKDLNNLNGLYTAFGKVKNGFDVVQKIKEVKTIQEEGADENSIQFFEEVPVIKNVTVETHGIDYKMPEYIHFDVNSYITSLIMQQYGLQ